MSYYAQLDSCPSIEVDEIFAFWLARQRVKENTDVYKYFLVDMRIDELGNMFWTDNYRKWYGDEGFVNFILPFANEGYLEFTGEEGEKWGYWFDGKGAVFECKYIRQVNEKPLFVLE